MQFRLRALQKHNLRGLIVKKVSTRKVHHTLRCEKHRHFGTCPSYLHCLLEIHYFAHHYHQCWPIHGSCGGGTSFAGYMGARLRQEVRPGWKKLSLMLQKREHLESDPPRVESDAPRTEKWCFFEWKLNTSQLHVCRLQWHHYSRILKTKSRIARTWFFLVKSLYLPNRPLEVPIIP